MSGMESQWSQWMDSDPSRSWSQFTSVDTDNAKADPQAGTVTVDLKFKRDGGDDTDETHVLTLVKDGDSWLIDDDARAGG